MSYESVVSISQTAALLFFLSMFAGVLLYVFWPGMKDRLERDQRKALDLEVNEKGAGGRS